MGIVAHYINAEDVLQSIVLGLPEVDGTHTGKSIANAIYSVIKDFKFQTNLGYFTMDNAANNDVIMRKLLASKSMHFPFSRLLFILVSYLIINYSNKC